MKTVLKHIRRYAPLALLLALMALIYTQGWHTQISLETLQDQKAQLQTFAAAKPISTAAIFVALYITAIALSLPVATLLTLTGGFLFGIALGTILVVFSATTGASILFLIARSAIGEPLRQRAGDLYTKIEKNMQDNATFYMLFMRLAPIFPFFLVNIVPALFNIRLKIFVLTTAIGIIPGSFIYVNLGQALGDIDTLKDLIAPQTIIALTLFACLALIPIFLKDKLKS